jgi:hypothetical protein
MIEFSAWVGEQNTENEMQGTESARKGRLLSRTCNIEQSQQYPANAL